METDRPTYPTIEKYRLILMHEIQTEDGTRIVDSKKEWVISHLCDNDVRNEDEIKNELLDELFTKSRTEIKEK